VKEETDLVVELISPLIPFERIVKSNGETILQVIYIDYMAREVGGELKPDSDVGQAVWVKQEEIASVWSNLHDDTKRLLQIAHLA
jgi:ADP-ribose pyrophosphatase YjhB (NUDIX family)